MRRGRSSQSNNQNVFQNNAQFWPGVTSLDVEDIDASQVSIQETIAKMLRIVLSADDVVSHHMLRSKVLNSERLTKNHLELAILALTSSNKRLLLRHGHGNFAVYEVNTRKKHIFLTLSPLSQPP
jgi:DNA-binding winged helix-turn-helix (wHTH) protein